MAVVETLDATSRAIAIARPASIAARGRHGDHRPIDARVTEALFGGGNVVVIGHRDRLPRPTDQPKTVAVELLGRDTIGNPRVHTLTVGAAIDGAWIAIVARARVRLSVGVDARSILVQSQELPAAGEPRQCRRGDEQMLRTEFPHDRCLLRSYRMRKAFARPEIAREGVTR